tara:strand:+ start:456 stop:1274 length:819 start_codon:yes stop_codon:yes gene_type:complete
MSKKSQLQDALVRFCIDRDGPNQPMYVFTNDDVKTLSMDVGFRNHNDATHIDTSANLSPLMAKEGLAVVHLGTERGVGNVAKHAFIRGVDNVFHTFEEIETGNVRQLKYRPGPLDHLNTSEANILSIVHNHGILREFLYPGDLRANPHIYMAHRTRVQPEYRIGSMEIPANLIQIEVDMTLEYDGNITVFEGKNWKSGRNDFAIYQLYMPFRYYHLRKLNGEIDIERIECCYVVRRKHKTGSDIDAYLYTFDDPEDMSSIRLLKNQRFELRE